ncbi:MAG: leucine-rich repeat domain-containing protein, partial [Gemmatimonadota bacterium]|nr:leucine-rich repeat domain-containing protein [Gemmatimonadota bacterium]
SNLTELDLGDNQLVGEIPKELGKLSYLEILRLEDNTSLMGELPQSLSGLTNLKQFYFYNTGLCAPLDPAFQTWLQGIEETNGSNCGVELGVSVCDRTNAVRDAIMAQVPVSTCGDVTAEHLSAISSLILDGANLTELKADDFSGLTGLTKLSLVKNQLSSIPSELFTLPNLTHLYLWGNQLSGEIPTALGNLSNLTYLDLGDNQLSGAIPTELGNLSNLTLLALHNNQLSGRIPTELGKLSNLEFLSLQDNTSLMGALPQSLRGLTKLKEFYFTNTGLCAPLDAAFQTWLQGITDASGSNCSG